MPPESPIHADTPTVLRDVLVPQSMLSRPDSFGGRMEHDCLRGDLLLKDGRATALQEAQPTAHPRMVLPALIEAHCHLDKCHSIRRLGAVGGDLSVALEAQRRDKVNWTAEDLRDRIGRGLAELTAAGCSALRSHIDWGEAAATPVAWAVLNELAKDHPALTIQAAALTGVSQLADQGFCFDAARQIAQQPGGVLGAFVLHHPPSDIAAGVKHAFAAADRFGLCLDFHVDEGLGACNGLEVICDVALETGFQGPVLCGHAVSLIDRTGDDLKRLLDKLARAGIAVCALPTTNLYLQGRRDGTPDRRGLTRLHELNAAGVRVMVASDNVGDAFCPTGQHDPRAALHLASLATHLDPPMGDWLPLVTTNPAHAMGLPPCFVDRAPLADLRLCAVSNTCDLVAGRAPLTSLPQFQETATP